MYGEAAQLSPNGIGVAVIIGGSYAVLSDRLPLEYRADAWSQAYEMYRKVWKQQSEDLDKVPLHIKGELLAGLAQTAQRTGRNTEMAENLSLIIQKLPGTLRSASQKNGRTVLK